MFSIISILICLDWDLQDIAVLFQKLSISQWQRSLASLARMCRVGRKTLLTHSLV